LLGDRTRYIAGLNSQSSGSLTVGSRLYVPQYVEDASFRSQLNVVNLNTTPADVSLQLVGVDGRQLGTVAQRTIAGRGKVADLSLVLDSGL